MFLLAVLLWIALTCATLGFLSDASSADDRAIRRYQRQKDEFERWFK